MKALKRKKPILKRPPEGTVVQDKRGNWFVFSDGDWRVKK